MTKQQKSNQNGGLNGAMTVPHQVTQSSSADLTPLLTSPLISDTSASTVPQKNDSPLTPNSLGVTPNELHTKLIHALAVKLGVLVEWRKVELGDGRTGWALFFDERKWLVDPLTKELTPLGEELK